MLEVPGDIRRSSSCEGLSGSAVIDQQVTDFVDLAAVIRRAGPRAELNAT